ncbi:hypothetical protein Slin15195_G001610 [Septoria linicola]|uniref:Uncharacterized protein n=1 Tax=Septoria linicola TaxID=215465 RepID=A0A9Q9AIR0_9PEZI|nr:hypothetical protein Slin14017_G001640 [Septoria linicola]USW46842.1 hypothetical protein Slin15195_G001610 [Septoria linicola]
MQEQEIEKSYVDPANVDELVREPKAKFKAGDKVSMVVVNGEDLVSGTFTVVDAKRQAGKATYKLKTGRGILHDDGKYFAENQLTRSR